MKRDGSVFRRNGNQMSKIKFTIIFDGEEKEIYFSQLFNFMHLFNQWLFEKYILIIICSTASFLADKQAFLALFWLWQSEPSSVSVQVFHLFYCLYAFCPQTSRASDNSHTGPVHANNRISEWMAMLRYRLFQIPKQNKQINKQIRRQSQG